MNLSNRIKKIEEQFGLNKPDANSCDCYGKYFMDVIESVYFPEKEHSIHPMPDFEKGFCDQCQKTISSKDIEYQKGIEKIYGDVDTYAYCGKHLKMPEKKEKIDYN